MPPQVMLALAPRGRPRSSSGASASPSPSMAPRTKTARQRRAPRCPAGRPDPARDPGARRWREMEQGPPAGVVTALNRFIHDVYHDQEILQGRHACQPNRSRNAQFRPEMRGRRGPGRHLLAHRRHRHRARRQRRRQRQLLRAGGQPARAGGVSYMLENRKMMMRLFPRALQPASRRAGRALPRPAPRAVRCARWRRRRSTIRWSSTRACTTAPTTSTATWPSRWASSWWKGRTCSSKTTSSTCARRKGRSGST